MPAIAKIKKNIEYSSKQISRYYSSNRQRWEEFYPSEKWVFERVCREQPLGDVLDVGCACGGLGIALTERFHNISSYTGVDINQDSIEWAEKNCKLTVPSHFIRGDILAVNLPETFDLVVSLSCADWNIETEEIIGACWKKVRPGGFFVISLRLSPSGGVNDIRKSYQWINFSGDEKGQEIANYVVFGFQDILKRIKKLTPQFVGSYGYWGKPSRTARTPFERLIFAVFYIKKGQRIDKGEDIKTELHLPLGAFL